MIAIVDYGAGNLRSVQNTLDAIGAEYQVLDGPAGLDQATKILLPGVGHYGQMMRALDERSLRIPLVSRASAGVPLLGICIGLQCLFQTSEEAPGAQGLGLFPGTVRRFPVGARVPHMGWNDLTRQSDTPLLSGLEEHPFVYFAHSYYVPVTDGTAATCEYELPYTAVFQKNNVFGVQFHPEKSGATGLQVVRNFIERC